MSDLCKFTDANGKTRAFTTGETQWSEGMSNSVEWRGILCAPGVLHAYSDPLLAVFRDPDDGCYLSKPGALLWRIIGRGQYTTDGLKDGWEEITTLEPMPIPSMSIAQRVEIAIRRSLDVYSEPSYIDWASNWLSGRDRSAESAARAAAESAWSAAGSAAGVRLLAVIHEVMDGGKGEDSNAID